MQSVHYVLVIEDLDFIQAVCVQCKYSVGLGVEYAAVYTSIATALKTTTLAASLDLRTP